MNQCALNCMPVDLEPFGSELSGISLAAEPGEAFYLPLVGAGAGDEGRCDREWVLAELKPILEDETIRKYGHNIKHKVIQLRRCGIELRGIVSDSMVASYLLNPGKHCHSLEEIALEWLDHKMIAYKEIAGSGKKELAFDQIGAEQVVNYACERAACPWRRPGSCCQSSPRMDSISSFTKWSSDKTCTATFVSYRIYLLLIRK